MIKIGNKKIEVVCNGATPLFYRRLLKRDIFIDLEKAEVLKGDEAIMLNLEIVENLLYVMAYQKDNSIGSIEEFMAQFKATDVINESDKILNVWIENMTTTEVAKKTN